MTGPEETAAAEPAWPPTPLHVAVDVVLLTVVERRLHVLLWQRPYPPFAQDWALPGTFSRPDERLDDTPRRALADKGGIEADRIEQLATYDQPPVGPAPGRDPRGRVVSVAYLALVRDGAQRALEDASRVRWVPVDAVPGRLAFDHERILADGVARLRAKARYSSLPFALLDEPFTLPELHATYEAVLGVEIDERNFRRDLHAAGVLDDTGDTRAAGPGRPARLYRRRPGAFAVDGEERRIAERIREA